MGTNLFFYLSVFELMPYSASSSSFSAVLRSLESLQLNL